MSAAARAPDEILKARLGHRFERGSSGGGGGGGGDDDDDLRGLRRAAKAQSCGELVVFWVVFVLAAGLTLYYGVEVTPTKQVCGIQGPAEARAPPEDAEHLGSFVVPERGTAGKHSGDHARKDSDSDEWNNAIVFDHLHVRNADAAKAAARNALASLDNSAAPAARDEDREGVASGAVHEEQTADPGTDPVCNVVVRDRGQAVERGRQGVDALHMHWHRASDLDALRRDAGPWVVTVVTQLGVNRLARLESMLEGWQGPISAAILVCSQQDLAAVETWLARMRSAQRDRLAERFLTIHLAVGPPDPYPINLLRNVAQAGAPDDQDGYSLVVDVDARIGAQALKVSQDLQRAVESLHLDATPAAPGALDKTVFCVAAFELAVKPSAGPLNRLLPRDYTELRAMVNAGAVRPMHVGKRSYSGPFNHAEWLARRDAYKLNYEVMFEPYYIRRSAAPSWPLFPEQFKGRGFNKQAHHFELFARGFEYVVLGRTYVVDLPHEAEAWSTSALTLHDNKPLWYEFREKIALATGLDCHEEDWARCDRRGVSCNRVCQTPPRSGSTGGAAAPRGPPREPRGQQDAQQSPPHAQLRVRSSADDEEEDVAPRQRPAARDRAAAVAAKSAKSSHGDLYWKVFLDGLESKTRQPRLPGNETCRDGHGDPVVDVVYTWVNGSDPAHAAARAQHIPPEAFEGSMDVGEGRSVPVGDLGFRFRDYERASTLLYSLRSIRAHAAWVRNIYVVVAGDQRPSWMDIKAAARAGIHFVSHETIFAADGGAAAAALALPTFNSCAIETQLHRIPGLAACYLYLNDDFLLGRELSFESLWPADEPVPRAHFGPERAPRVGRDPWQQKIANVGKMMHRDLGLRWEHMFTVGHQGFFFVKSVVSEVEALMRTEFERTSREQWRTPSSLWVPFAYANYYAHTYQAQARKGSALYIRLNDFSVRDGALDAALARVRTRNPQWICINDLVTTPSKDLVDGLESMLSTLFPDPAPHELLYTSPPS